MAESLKILYVGVCKENLERYYPSYIRGEFFKEKFTDAELVDTIIQNNINVLMVDVFHSSFTDDLLRKLKDHIKLINFSYQSIDSLIDLDAAEKYGIRVCKLPDDIYCHEVAEFAMTQLLCACKGSIVFDQSIRRGEWNQAVNANISLQGKTLGVVGYGNIGRNIVRLCENWGMDILVARKHPEKSTPVANVNFVDFSSLIENSDFIIFALPIKKDTYQMFNAEHVQRLKQNSIIVNVSRGDIVDENAVHEALQSGRLYCYCTDVFSEEPVSREHGFVQSSNTILSPHIAWATEDTLKKTFEIWFSLTTI